MRTLYALGLVLGTSVVPAAARAETMSEALARAYLANPVLNRDRAATRAADEAVSKAKAGYRPHVEANPYLGFDSEDVTGGRRTAGASIQATETPEPATRAGGAGTRRAGSRVGQSESQAGAAEEAPTLSTLDLARSGNLFPKAAKATVTQRLFDGNRTTNGVRRAESQDLGSREGLRQTEQETLLAGATAYMDVLRDIALEALARNEIKVLEYELRGARARYRANEVTFTDVAQVATSLARGRTGFFRAQAALATSMASFRRIIGTPPSRLEAARPVDAVAPATREAAIAAALQTHPGIARALHEVDATMLLVQLREGELYPTVDLVGRGEHLAQVRRNSNDYSRAEVTARIAVPLYKGGETYAAVRQAKEQVAAARLKADAMREQVRADVASTWGQLAAAKALIVSSKAAVQASEVALVDVRAEASMGQRTTYDVLLAIQALFAARTTLVAAQRDRVVASYELAAATGRLSATNLSLAVVPYDPTVHFAQVKDKWFGLRTPDGR